MQDHINDKPPVLGSWKSIYLTVILFLVLQIFVYYLITIALK